MVPRLIQALPPALSDYIAHKIETGAAVHKLVQLNTTVPTRGPYVVDLGGAYTLNVYGGPLMRYEAVARIGRNLDVSA